MNTKQQVKELQESYQAMVDHVEQFVVKEGKTLQQAFLAAEEKLSETKDISKEKILQASKNLKENLQLWSDAVDNVSDAYKAQIEFDLAYVNNSLWDKLKSVANSTTAELYEFTHNLKQNSQAVITDDHVSMHQEHKQWGSEHALWLDEIELWKKDHNKALSKLSAIEKALQQHSASLAEHAQVIEAHANKDHEHEKTMANVEQDPSSKTFKLADEKEIAMHKKEQQIHKQHAKFHHAVKTHHFKILAMINMLYKEINKIE
ncbi:hypothetical protein [Paraglaciecola sp. L3A3]|uniref:zinc ribbon-containing protein n=1 Tax=Paraglaciecola sp. L3A3 TaxID=2686358 RepID=UPI00131AA0D6|nr:hypothetical protein [Paraglaciecola sp. L3A3]